MKKLALIGFLSVFLVLAGLVPVNVFAIGQDKDCNITTGGPNGGCDNGLICQREKTNSSGESVGKCAPATINVTRPIGGFANISNFIGNTLTLSFGIAILIVLVFLIWGAFDWITSGGDKEAVGKARSKIINALIGLAVLAVAYALARVAAQFLGFDIANITIPAPAASPSGL